MNDALPTIADIARYLEQWAPPSSAQAYDNVGLQVGDPRSKVQRAVIALDMTPAVLREVMSVGATLIITHHPLIFQPLRSLTPSSLSSNLALQLAEARVALYSIHTNLDAAPGGVSFALGETLGLHGLEFLELNEDDDQRTGLGAVGALDEAMTLESFLYRISERLGSESIHYAGISDAVVKRVAVCGGAGAEFVHKALAAGVDAYVTSDVKYHQYFDVLNNDGYPRMAFIDAGHYETEAMSVDLLRKKLAGQFPRVDWLSTKTRTSPVHAFSSRNRNAE
jgi:dinuclear metal center YbgI/SA1388 family protein